MEIKYRCQSLSRVRIPFSPPFKSADKALFLWRAGGERGEEALIRRVRSPLVTTRRTIVRAAPLRGERSEQSLSLKPFKSADKALFLWRAGEERGEEALIRRVRSPFCGNTKPFDKFAI